MPGPSSRTERRTWSASAWASTSTRPLGRPCWIALSIRFSRARRIASASQSTEPGSPSHESSRRTPRLSARGRMRWQVDREAPSGSSVRIAAPRPRAWWRAPVRPAPRGVRCSAATSEPYARGSPSLRRALRRAPAWRPRACAARGSARHERLLTSDRTGLAGQGTPDEDQGGQAGQHGGPEQPSCRDQAASRRRPGTHRQRQVLDIGDRHRRSLGACPHFHTIRDPRARGRSTRHRDLVVEAALAAPRPAFDRTVLRQPPPKRRSVGHVGGGFGAAGPVARERADRRRRLP